MNTWSNTVLTDKGLALMAKLTQGNTLNITKAMTGAGFVTPGFLSKQTEVTDPKQTLSFKPVSYPETGKCAIPVALKNEGLTTGYEATQVGLFAEDPDEGEILFFISQAADAEKGTIIPSETEMPGYAAEWTFYLAYGQADKVEVTVDQAGAVSRAEFDERMKKCATLDDEGKVPEEQLPDTTYIPVTSEVPSDSDIWIDPDETAIEESHVTDRNNPHGVTIAQIGAAPSGYGYGEPCVSFNHTGDGSEANFESALDEIIAGMKNLEAKQICFTCTDIASTTFYGTIYKHRSNYVIVTGISYWQNGVVSKTKFDGKWYPHQWDNPPMELGKEYRTTERNGGSTVYVKRIAYKLGAINASGASVDSIIPHGISDFAYLVRTHCVKDSYVLPYLKSDGGFTSITTVDATNITLRAYKATWAEATWLIDLYYVKY